MNTGQPIATESKSGCPGSVFVASVKHKRIGRGFSLSIKLLRSKKHSCPGCEKCGWESDAFAEVGDYFSIHDLETAQDGELYTIGMVEIEDRSTGFVDEFYLRLVPFDERK